MTIDSFLQHEPQLDIYVYIVNKPLPWYVVLSYTGPRSREIFRKVNICPRQSRGQMRDFEDNLEAEGLYKLNTTYHGSGLFIL